MDMKIVNDIPNPSFPTLVIGNPVLFSSRTKKKPWIPD